MISIIVPVYKVEKYLHACIESVLAQTYQDWELLLIDDGSPDGCPAICDEYAQKDPRIRAIHKENGGVSSARNRGLDEANGEWVMFLDSDDMLVPNALEHCCQKMFQCGVDVVCFNHMTIDENGCIIDNVEGGSEYLETNIEYTTKVLEAKTPLVIWNKLYKKSVVCSTRFSLDLNIGEDYLFLLQVFCQNSCKILHIMDVLYRYRIIPTSLTRTEGTKINEQKRDRLCEETIRVYESLRSCKVPTSVFLTAITRYTTNTIKLQGCFKRVSKRHIEILKEYGKDISKITLKDPKRVIQIVKYTTSPRVASITLTAYFLPLSLKKTILDFVRGSLKLKI